MNQPEDTTELDDLLAESQANDPLDSLLAESLEAVNVEKEAKAARERVKRGGQSVAQRQEDAERIRRWELAREWETVANVALFERHTCQCGKHSTIFRQLLTRQTHRTLRHSTRWQTTDKVDTDLPYEVVVQKWESPMCVQCSDIFGFEFKGVTEWKGE